MRQVFLISLCFLPFFFFTATYFALSLFTRSHTILVPHVTGLPFLEAATLISAANLQLRILKVEKNEIAPPSTVLKQSPHPQQRARPQQTVYITLSERPEPPVAPQLLTLMYGHVEAQVRQLGIYPQFFSIPSNYPPNTCIGQSPASGQACSDNKMIIYVSAGSETVLLMPNLIGRQYEEVVEFLTMYKVKVHVTQQLPYLSENSLKKLYVKEQMPYPGAFINLQQLATVHLALGPKNSLHQLAELLF